MTFDPLKAYPSCVYRSEGEARVRFRMQRLHLKRKIYYVDEFLVDSLERYLPLHAFSVDSQLRLRFISHFAVQFYAFDAVSAQAISEFLAPVFFKKGKVDQVIHSIPSDITPARLHFLGFAYA